MRCPNVRLIFIGSKSNFFIIKFSTYILYCFVSIVTKARLCIISILSSSIHSNPEERKPEGVLQLSHNKPRSTCQQSFAEDHQRQNKAHYDREMAEEQAGFVEGKGTREQIVNIRIIIEKCRDQNIPLYMCFICLCKP